jgi:SAM-dependent methyltransferase
MAAASGDGSAGDADYGAIGTGYSRYRRPDPAIAAAVADALGPAGTVCNVGAGAGGYEPADRPVVAVEPSAVMRSQRAPGRGPQVAATAEALPFADGAFSACMTTFSVHQWAGLEAGLAEMRRVGRGAVVVLTCDPTRLDRFWLAEYAPEVLAVEAARYPGLDRLADGLGGAVGHIGVPVPLACTDGFNEAYYGRPEALLDPGARRSCSAWSFVGPDVHDRFERALRRDLETGRWDERHGHLRTRPTFPGSLVLVVSVPGD